jgi:hypothetical protein
MKIRGFVLAGFAICFILLFSFGAYAVPCSSLGSTPRPAGVVGYVDDTTGARIIGANVTGETVCWEPAQDAGLSIAPDGYYQVWNLASPLSNGLAVSANYIHPVYGLGYGINIKNPASSNERLNVTICYPPTSPSLTAIPDGHDTAITFRWVTGNDPLSYGVRDEFALTGGVTYSNSINPAIAGAENTITQNVVTNQDYAWRVRTCNIPNSAGRSLQDVYCCSEWVSSSFHIGNMPPSEPSGNTTKDADNAILNWTSGIDPEGDPTYDQFRLVGGNAIGNLTNSALPVVVMPIQLLISWEIRTCDNFNDCSAWVRIDSVFCPSVGPASCPSCVCSGSSSGGGGGGGGGGGVVTNLVQVPVSGGQGPEVYCNGEKIDSDLLRKIDLKFSGEKLKLVASGDMFSTGDLNVCPSCFNGKQDAGEEGVDCGGSCSSCSSIPRLVEKFQWLFLVIALLLILIAGMLARPYYYIAYIRMMMHLGRSALLRNEASAFMLKNPDLFREKNQGDKKK